MSAGPLAFEIVLTFFIASAILYRYGNWYRHHILVTVAVLIAWYFSMLIVFVLPIDISNTIYETCLHNAETEALKTSTAVPMSVQALNRMKKSKNSDALSIDEILPKTLNAENISRQTEHQTFPPPGFDDDIVVAAQKALTANLNKSNLPLHDPQDKVSKTSVMSTNSSIDKPPDSPAAGDLHANKTFFDLNNNNLTHSDALLTEAPSNSSKNSSDEYIEKVLYDCREPMSRVQPWVFPALWRVVYWTSQVLTWLLLPLMQSYTKAGEFTVWGKLRSALIDNAIYYGSYLLIVGILLLYIALKPDVHLNGSQLRAIAASASNTWGLFWLVLLLGYGLVEVPRWLWNSACPQFMLNQSYFKSAKLAHERAEAWDHLNDLLQSVNSISSSLGSNHPLRSHLDTIESRVPTELLDKMRRAPQHDSSHSDVPSEKALVRLHKQLLKALQHHNRVETQWSLMVEKIIYLEDAQRNSCSHDMHFKHSTPRQRNSFLNLIYTPTIEWLWVCRVRGYLLRFVALVCALVSTAVVWSELTFFNKSPTLSIFAIIVDIAKSNHDYITIEVISTLTMAYIALCAYSTLTAIRVLNLYYLAPHHQTDQYSLIFSGMMLCRLTPPMCLNFLSLIHMDSHIIGEHTFETHYTQVMGHMDVISIISDGFNIYFPMMIVGLCLATYFSLGSRLLSAMGFQQFIGTDSFTTDLIDEGRTLINREHRKRVRQHEYAERRKEFNQRFGIAESPTSLYRSARQRAEELLSRPYRKARNGGNNDSSAAQMELLTPSSTLQYGEPPSSPSQKSSRYATHYSSHDDFITPDTQFGVPFSEDRSPTDSEGRFSHARPQHPDRGLFDDI